MSKVMDKFSKFLENHLMPLGAKVGNQIHLRAVRDGMMSTIPLTVIGGLFLIIANPPVTASMQATNPFNSFMLAWAKWATANKDFLMTPYRMTFALMGLVVAFAVAYSMAKLRKLDPLTNAVVSATTFLMVSAPMKMGVLASNLTSTLNDAGMVVMDKAALGKATAAMIPTTYLDSKGLFTAMIIGLLSVEISKFLMDKNVVIKMPEGVPPAISNSFNALAPMLVNILVFYGFNTILTNSTGMNIPAGILKLMTPAMAATDNIWFILGMILLANTLWFVGVHGSSIATTILIPLFMNNMLENAASYAAGSPMTHVWIKPLWATTIALGGSGATLALCILMLTSKASQLKTIGKISILPGLFNVNEPIIFGTPIVMNPILFLPFIFVPMINAIIANAVMVLGIVGRPFADIPWTTPAIIGAGLTTMDFKAVILVAFLIVLDVVLYYPFFKVLEKEMIIEEKKANEAEIKAEYGHEPVQVEV